MEKMGKIRKIRDKRCKLTKKNVKTKKNVRIVSGQRSIALYTLEVR